MSDYTKPYLYSEWKKAVERMAQQEVYETAAEPESQFKKPYLQDISYPVMEYEWDYRNGPYNPGMTQPFETDCTPQGYAVGGGSPETFCDEVGVFCGVWEFTCAHKIRKFGVIQNNGWIQSVQYFKNDVVRVTVCFDESNKGQISGPQAYMANGRSVVAKVSVGTACQPIIHGQGYMCHSTTQTLTVESGIPPYSWSADCGTLNPTVGQSVSYTAPGNAGECTVTVTDSAGRKATLKIKVDANPNIKFLTRTMTFNQQQALIAEGVPPFSWSLISGGGSLSSSSGSSVIYTAPSSNPDCVNNPTIRLSDACGGYVDLSLGVTNPNLGSSAAYQEFYNIWIDTTPDCFGPYGYVHCRNKKYATYKRVTCTGVIGCYDENREQPSCDSGVGCQEDWQCEGVFVPDCSGACDLYDVPCGIIGGHCSGIEDIRSPSLKSQGCCPYPLS